MPLIDLQTDLKSLKFGKDRPGGGSSNQPYIKKDIPGGDASNLASTGGPDFLLRGGILAPVRAVNDVSRLTQMFFDLKTPSGPLFIAKENLLSRTSVKTEASEGPGYGGGALNQGIYTPLSTIGQAVAGIAGGHLNLLGVDPTGLTDFGLNDYFSTVKTNNEEGNNRLVNLLDNEDLVNIQSYSGGPGSILGIGDTNIRFADQRTGENNPLSLNPGYFYTGSVGNSLTDTSDLDEKRYFQTIEAPLILSTNRFDTFTVAKIGDTLLSPFTINNKLIDDVVPNTGSYQNGLKNSSTNRIGLYGGNLDYAKLIRSGSSQTYIDLVSGSFTGGGEIVNNNFYNGDHFNVYTQGNTFPEVGPLQSVNNSSTWTQEQLINANPISNGGTEDGVQQDFRKPLLDGKSSSTIMSLSPSYNPAENKTIEGRVNLGNPGTKKNVLKYSTSTTILDKINGSGIYVAENPNHKDELNDLCKFSIGLVNNDNTGNSTFMNFRAFLDSFDDQYSADWGNTQYIGRADKFYNYKGFDRTVNLSWTVFAQSKAELIPMYKKLNYLASSLAPNYSEGGYMQGNLARLTVGGYIYNQLGIIKGITYSVPQESPWEIAINEEGGSDRSVKELPHMIKVTGFQFIPIQDFVPARGQRFISLANGLGSSNNNYDS